MYLVFTTCRQPQTHMEQKAQINYYPVIEWQAQPYHLLSSSYLTPLYRALHVMLEQCPYIETRMAKLLSRASCFWGTDEAWQIFLSINRNRKNDGAWSRSWRASDNPRQTHFLCSAANVTTLWRFDTFNSFPAKLKLSSGEMQRLWLPQQYTWNQN